jgi:hypothetical protein
MRQPVGIRARRLAACPTVACPGHAVRNFPAKRAGNRKAGAAANTGRSVSSSCCCSHNARHTSRTRQSRGGPGSRSRSRLRPSPTSSLAASAVDAVAFGAREGVVGHAVVSNDTRASDTLFDAAVVKSGAQGLLLVRLLSVDTRTQGSTVMVRGGMGWGVGPMSRDRRLVPAQQVRRCSWEPE